MPMPQSPCAWNARSRRGWAARGVGRRRGAAARDICDGEYVAALQASLHELHHLLALLRQIAGSGAADALARIGRLLDAS